MEHGSLQNMMYANSSQEAEKIEIGMGATKVMWTDRDPFTVIDIFYFKSGPNKGKVKGVIVQADDYKRLDDKGPFTESQDYEYTPNPNGITYEVTIRKDGRWRSKNDGTTFLIGIRDKYYDPTF